MYKAFVVVNLILSLYYLPSSKPQSYPKPDENSVKLVKSAIQQIRSGILFSIYNKRIPRLGDEAAICLMEIFSEEDLSKEENFLVYLPIIQDSFSSCKSIKKEENKNPKFSLLLLNRLLKVTKNQKSRERLLKVISQLEKIKPIREFAIF